MPKAILVYDSLVEIGGLERVMAAHAHYLEKMGFDVTLLFGHVKPGITDYAFLKGLHIRELSPFKFKNESVKVILAILGLHRLRKYKHVDLIFTYSPISNFWTHTLGPKRVFYYLPAEFVYYPLKERWLWADVPKRKIAFLGSLVVGWYIKHIDQTLTRTADLLFANSEYLAKEVIDRYGLHPIVLYPPVNPVFKPVTDTKKAHAVLKKYNIDKPFILSAGRLVPDKHFDWLIEAFSKMKSRNNYYLVCAGPVQDSFKQELLQLARKCGVAKQLKLLGLVTQEELVSLYGMAELFPFTSAKEAFGLVPIESIACGTPCVVWDDHAGPEETVKPGVNGFAAKPYNNNDLAEKMDYALQTKFKQKHFKTIVQSAQPFLDAEQFKIFKTNVEKLLKN
ncbi:glycosyltransferase family 4 protein [Candidatus Woesearchaeota archaeon]|nr:glycosyltransferase family 4 protein [Candidatus Woesearchaeota archaeon]